ncbi:MAG: bifunctional glutamate N-acetyltransferase/amino-acid acetyltransferase ArgJ [Chloroflexi bacterium]|nr:bifunctional glutamate N-acetyltransferase/amino-acid acetyltransferase ArgJ [Chloroflexota bacterium]
MTAVEITFVEGGALTSVPGFQATGVACGLKKDGALDLALVYSAHPCAGAALFTTNAFKAAPVLYDQRVVRANPAGLRAVVINSGCANACTGEQGMRDAEATAAIAAELLGIGRDDVLVMSTGVIGQLLPMSKIKSGLFAAAQALDSTLEGGHRAARAIMTTDTRPKEVAVRVRVGGSEYTIAGMAKGAGMIHPHMATMLSLIVTDAPITAPLAQKALAEATEVSFNMITVDGDMSTNDTVALLANGQADMPPIVQEGSPAYQNFCQALTQVATFLAQGLVRDGEGATRFVEITVGGARSRAEAKQVAMSVATSLLVKTAIYGQDANWGRIVCAVGYSGVEIVPNKVRVWLGDLELVRNGGPYQVDEARASAILAQTDIPIRIDLGLGAEEATVWTSDLSHAYVDINAHYRT